MFSMPSIFGVILIIAIKFAGYRYAGILLNKRYDKVSVNPNIFGIVRVVLGLAAGSLFAYILAKWDVNNGMVWWYVWLFPLRFLEWLLMIGVFHERKAAERKPLRL